VNRNAGWYQLAMALDYERFADCTAAANQSLIDELIQYVKEVRRPGTGSAETSCSGMNWRRLVVENEVVRTMCYRIA